MPTVEVSVTIKQPPEVVAQTFLNAEENAPLWEKDLERFEVVTGEPGVEGSHARLHYQQQGQPYYLDDVLEEYIPKRYFRSTVSGGGISARVETWLQPADDGTEVRMRWQGRGKTIPTLTILPFIGGTIRRQMQEELETFKTLVEESGAHFGGD